MLVVNCQIPQGLFLIDKSPGGANNLHKGECDHGQGNYGATS